MESVKNAILHVKLVLAATQTKIVRFAQMTFTMIKSMKIVLKFVQTKCLVIIMIGFVKIAIKLATHVLTHRPIVKLVVDPTFYLKDTKILV